jgi:hypothetical protein
MLTAKQDNIYDLNPTTVLKILIVTGIYASSSYFCFREIRFASNYYYYYYLNILLELV